MYLLLVKKGRTASVGSLKAILNFTKSNEIYGFYFDIEQIREYQVTGCVEGRVFTIWLEQGDIVEAVIQGPRAAVETVVGFMRTGPPGAVVADISVSWRPAAVPIDGFDIRY